jgi:FkbM family methyltransferase
MIRTFIKRLFNLTGLDIVRMSKYPGHSLLGLRKLPIRTVIDVGANKGQFAKIVTNIFPEAHIYSFEPLPEAFEHLKEWADRRGDKFTAYNISVGEKEGEVEMLKHVDYSPSSSLLKTTETCGELYPFTKNQETIPVKITTLDRWLDSLNHPPARDILIKMDVQGYEDRVIAGASRTLEMAKVCIAEVSLDQLYESQSDFKDILTLLYDRGYRYAGNLNQAYAEDGHVIFVDTVFVKHH